MRKIHLWNDAIRAVVAVLILASAASAQTWVELSPVGGPSGPILGRQAGFAGYDAANNRLIVYFSSNPAVSSLPSPEVWVLTNANGLGGTPVWIQLLPSGSPPLANTFASGVYDAATNRLIVYGGCYSSCGSSLDSVIALTNANGLGGTPAWVPLTVSNPRARDGHTAVYDPANNRMITFGGGLAFFGTDQNDTAVLSNANGVNSPSTWTTLSTLGGPPAIRESAGASYHQAGNRMILFAGNTLNPDHTVTEFNDLWVLSNANGLGGSPTWTLQAPLGSPPHARVYHSQVYDSTNNRMIVFGGLSELPSCCTYLGDLWQLSNADGLGGTPTWTQLSPSGTPPGIRYSHAAVFDTVNQRMIVFGGAAGANASPDKRVWVLILGLTITTTSPLPAATVGVAYSQTLAASGGTSPYNWSVISGSLPAGLTLNSATGVIAGTPTSANTYGFTARVSDNVGSTAMKDFQFSINTPLPFNIPNLGATSIVIGSSSGTVAVGYASNQPNSGNITPSGVSIFGVRNTAGALISEASVAATPLMQTGQLYVEVNGPVDTGLAMANPGTQDATVNFSFTDTTGRMFGAGSTTIPAGQQISKFLDQAPFNGGKPIEGTFTFSSTVPVTVIALRGFVNERGEFLITTLPVVDLSAPVGSSAVLLPHFADGGGWVTSVILVNPSDSPINGSIQFLDPSGSLTTLTAGAQSNNTFSYAIPGRSSFKLVTAGAETAISSGSVRVLPAPNTGAPTALAVFSYKRGAITVTEAGVPSIAGTAFRMYVEGSGAVSAPGSIQTGVAIANAAISSAAVNLELFKSDGASAGATSMTIPGSGQVAKFLNELFPNLPQPFQGVLRITTSSSGLAVVGLRARYNERGDFLITTTPPAGESPISGPLYFPQLAVGGGYSTQLILFSSSGASSGVLKFTTQSGTPLPIAPQ